MVNGCGFHKLLWNSILQPLLRLFFFFPVSHMCLALKGPEQMGALTALRVTSWKREDVYRAAV